MTLAGTHNQAYPHTRTHPPTHTHTHARTHTLTQPAPTCENKVVEYPLPTKICNAWKTRVWHFDLLEMAWRQQQTTIVILMRHSCLVVWEKIATCNERTQRYIIWPARMYYFLNTSSKISHNPPSIHLYIVNLWIFFMFLKNYYWHQAKVATGCRVTIGPLNPWWRHQMETFSALLALCAGNSPMTGRGPVSFDFFFDLRLE